LRLLCFFACEPSPDGLDFGEELRQRYEGLLKHLRGDPLAHVLFAGAVPGFKPETRYSELMAERLEKAGIAKERIHVSGDVSTSASEIDSMEEFLPRHPQFTDDEAASSWYHVPRIRTLWKIKHGRKVKGCYLSVPLSFFILKRTALELPKFALAITPSSVQDALAKIARRIGAI